MLRLARFVIAYRWLVLAAWLVLAVAGGFAAPRATAALSYSFNLPGERGYETNQLIAATFASGGANAPVLMVLSEGAMPLQEGDADTVMAALTRVLPGVRLSSYADQPALLSRDRQTGVIVVYPRPTHGADPYAQALPVIRQVAAQASRSGGLQVAVTGQDALATGGGGGGASVLAETLLGAVGALLVLALVFGSFLALTPLVVAAASILSTFLMVWGLTGLTDVSFIVQYLLALIGLGVAIDYALLIVTRWREERGRGMTDSEAIERALATAGRSVLFSGVTVAVSLAALIALPVPFLRSVGYTGLLIPLVSVAAALTLLPALLLVAGTRLSWPNRRSTNPESPLWRRVGTAVVARPWLGIAVTAVVLLALASPVLGLRLGSATNASLASTGGSAAVAINQLDASGLGQGLSQPVEILVPRAKIDQVRKSVLSVPGVAAAITPAAWDRDGVGVLDVWTSADTSSGSGVSVAARVAAAATAAGGQAGGLPIQSANFISAVYGNAWWIALIIVAVTFLLLARALRSIVLPIKALLLNVVSLAAAYGLTVLIWQHGIGVHTLFNQARAGAVTVWVPVTVFAYLFGLSMDYEVFLVSRIGEEHDNGHPTDEATVHGLARTGRLVTSAALILFLAFVSLSRVPDVDVKILSTALAFGIIIDATLVRGVLAPALVAALGDANWWLPRRRDRSRL